MALFLLLALAIALTVVSYLIMPKPKQAKPDAAKQMDSPTAEAGREIPVIFGSVTMKSPNFLDFSEKSIHTYEIKV